MTKFETMLIDKGYIKHILNCKTMKYERTDKHTLSSMKNLDHRYIHKDNKVLLDKIAQGLSVMDEDNFTWEDRESEICFGMCEVGKPPTLISPRPKITVKRERDFGDEKHIVTEDQYFDYSMNMVLMKEDPELIFDALFDSSIFFHYDLT
jgi:hypothetical protein